MVVRLKSFCLRRGFVRGTHWRLFYSWAGVSRMTVENNLIDSLEIGRKKVEVNMLQYANDTLFLCEANTKSVFNIKAALTCFELCSGLKVNFLKSRIGGLGLDQSTVQKFAAILNFNVMETPFMYLGMLVGGCHKRERFWGGVIDRLEVRLNRWKGRFFFTGRICLIKYILSSIPLFYLSLFNMSYVVANEIVKIQKNFI